jgi:hypothetical protein
MTLTKTDKYIIKYSHLKQDLTVTMTKVPGTESTNCALSDRPIPAGAPASYPHDAIAQATWIAAFQLVAATLATPVAPTDRAYAAMVGRTSPRDGKSPAVADGKSLQPFDGQVHRDRSAVQRHDDGAPSANPLWAVWFGNPAIGTVTQNEYQGQDWARMNRKQKLAAMSARAQAVINDIKDYIDGDRGLQRFIAAPGSFGSVANAKAFLDRVYVVVLRLARKR